VHRLDFVDSVLAGPGPIVQLANESGAGRIQPPVFRSFGSAFGRLQGPGIASVISSSTTAGGAGRQVDWSGDRNVFAGWRGFFSQGTDPTIVVGDLAGVRSTWNATDQNSQEILPPWPQPADLALATPREILAFLPVRPGLLPQVAQPRSGLFEKTVAAYLDPVIPEPIGWAVDFRFVPGGRPARARISGPNPQAARGPADAAGNGSPSRAPTSTGGIWEMTLNTGDPTWNGDLGAFLRDRLTSEMKHARVRVEGSGWHHFTPVELPEGIHLEIRVDSRSNAELPSWSAAPQATGTALIALRQGALVLSHVLLYHAPDSRLENLISIEDAHLVLSHCQLAVPPSLGNVRGGLIAFRAATTEPRPTDLVPPLFTVPVDRPVCRLIDSILIGNGTALRAELGRGLIALRQCAVAGGDAALELVPSRVSRSRFEVDLCLDQCTIVSERSIVRLGPWPGPPYGPDRPWLVTTRDCAFLAVSERRARGETVLLRADADALARGTLFWQAVNDAADVDLFTAAGDAPIPQNRGRDVQLLWWTHFWGLNHMSRITGRGAGGAPSVAFWSRPRPGRIEPADLMLDPSYHPDRPRLTVGADLGRQGIVPRAARSGPR
jgi:serine/threonine-protein kinase